MKHHAHLPTIRSLPRSLRHHLARLRPGYLQLDGLTPAPEPARLELALRLPVPSAHPGEALASAAQLRRLDRLGVEIESVPWSRSQADWLLLAARNICGAVQNL